MLVHWIELLLHSKHGFLPPRHLRVCLRLPVAALRASLSRRRLHDGMRCQHDLQRRLQRDGYRGWRLPDELQYRRYLQHGLL